MRIEEAIVYVLASSGHGMKTEQIAREIKDVTAKMQDAAAKLDFEQAVKYRDRLTQLKDLLIKSK